MVMLDRKLYRIRNYPRAYKKKLKRINKTRERLNVANHIQEVFNELEDDPVQKAMNALQACRDYQDA